MMTIPMAELEIDDVAFLTSTDSNGIDSKQTCGRLCRSGRHSSQVTHSVLKWRKSNVLTMSLCALLVITIIALIIAFFPFHNQCFSNHFEGPPLTPSTASSASDGIHYRDQNQAKLMSTSGEPFPWTDIRLPTFIVPHTYELYMSPDMTTFYNNGSVTIELTVTEKTDFLVIHIKKLNITNIFMSAVPSAVSLPVEQHLECIKNEQLYIRFANSLMPYNNYSLRIEFERQLEEQLEGFYVSSYQDSKTGAKKYLLTTHFEPTAARTAFPCFDEPALKAKFSMNLVHEKRFQVFFNSEKSRSVPVDKEGHIMTVFEPTVPMSTYLVAFIVCDFNTIVVQNRDGVNIRAVVPQEQEYLSQYALNSAASILSYYQDFFNVTYPLSKLDLVAVPDFAAGAMENWGIITFRTTMFLYNNNESSVETQEQVAVVIAHELAHQWFGNLVTMDWWNDLWLNEGFASYLENLGVDHISPQWKMLEQFVISTTQQAMSMDSLQSSHPIMADVKNPSEIEALFDAISYKKGSSLIRMLDNFLGTDKLKIGLSKYLHKYQYKTAKTSDLWNCLSEVDHKNSVNVTKIMATWVQQKGYPVVTVRREGDRLVLSQRRFLSSPPNTDAVSTTDISPHGYKWIIPVTVITNRNTGSSELFWFDSTQTTIPLDPNVKWFKLNPNQTGFYRVHYESDVWRDLSDVLIDSTYNRHVLSATDRANLIDDAFALMKIGILDVEPALRLTQYLRNNERDYVPWETALYHFGILDAIMLQHPLLHKYIQGLIEPLVTIWGWQDSSSDQMLVRKLRSLLLRAAVSYGDKPSIQQAIRYFNYWMNNDTKVAANLREVVYNTGVQFGGYREWNYVWNKYLNTSIPSEKRILLGALGQTRNAFLLLQYLNNSLNKDLVKTQDTVHVITVAAHNPTGRDVVWKFVKEHWSEITNLFGEGSFSLDNIISECVSHFTTPFELKEVETFFKSVSIGSGAQSVAQSLEKIRANIFWKENIENNVIRWLERHNNHSMPNRVTSDH